VYGRGETCSGFWWEKDHWGGQVVDRKIILKRIFRKWEVGYGLD
jgi:hypothetical protein